MHVEQNSCEAEDGEFENSNGKPVDISGLRISALCASHGKAGAQDGADRKPSSECRVEAVVTAPTLYSLVISVTMIPVGCLVPSVC